MIRLLLEEGGVVCYHATRFKYTRNHTLYDYYNSCLRLFFEIYVFDRNIKMYMI